MTIITPQGPETLVNTATFGNQAQARGTALANGQYVVVWVDYLIAGQLTPANTANADIKARLFNADGTPAGNEFTVNTVTAGGQIFCNAITLSDGNFLVTWNNGAGTVQGGAGAPIATARGQEFTATGVPVGGEFAIGNAGVETLLVASSGLAGGGFVSTWQQGGSGGAIVAQIYDSNNAAVGSQIVVDSTNLPPVGSSSVRTLTNGNFVVAWNNAAGSGQPIVNLQVYTAAGVPVGPPAQAGFGAVNGGFFSSLVALTTGGFALGVVEVTAPTAYQRIYAYEADGTFLGYTTTTEQFIGQTGQNPLGLALTALANGGVAATWIDNNPTDGSGTSIRLTTYGPSGEAFGTPVTVNTTTAGNQIAPTMFTLSNGDFVTLWNDASGSGGDTSGTSIRQQVFDVNPVNRAPIAVADRFVAFEGFEGFPVDQYLLDNDSDPDGDILIVTGISNVSGGTVTFDFANQAFNLTRPQGSTAPVYFDYTVSDGLGGTAVGRVTLIGPREDIVTLRGAAPPVDFLANDYLAEPTSAYTYSAMVISGNGGTQSQLIVNTIDGPRLNFLTLNVPNYLTLAVGASITVDLQYTVTNNTTFESYSELVRTTLQGWAQTGGTGFDALGGSALADHLIGGSGAANELIGRAGDDYYTSSAIGDTIFELANEGIDTVRTVGLTTFTLPDNVEHLQVVSATGSFVGIGNALDNNIFGSTVTDFLAGGAGNDRIFGGSGAANELVGGTGNDLYVVSVAGDTIVEFAGEGIDTVQTSLLSYALRAELENLSYTGTGSFQGLGNSADNVLTGGTVAASALVGLGGNDTYVIRNAGDSIVEAAGGGTDTVQTALSVYTLSAANVENLTYTGTGSFTGIGNSGNNVITGGAQGDFLFAGAGTDTLTGGAGADIFFFDTAVNGIDTITDFTRGSDRIFLNRAVFAFQNSYGGVVAGFGPQVATSNGATILFNTQNGVLSFDADGNGPGAAFDFAIVSVVFNPLSPGTSLGLGDFVFYG